jgi:hypothetical protein
MTQKITMGRDRRQDDIDARNAMRQSGDNAYVNGIAPPVGDQVAMSRSKLGAPRVMPQTLMEPDGNFAQSGGLDNRPVDNAVNTTGSVELQTSATQRPEEDPDMMQTDALESRLNMYATAASNAGYSLNDRYETGSL